MGVSVDSFKYFQLDITLLRLKKQLLYSVFYRMPNNNNYFTLVWGKITYNGAATQFFKYMYVPKIAAKRLGGSPDQSVLLDLCQDYD